MDDRPSAAELVAAVRDFLEKTARPALSGHAAFHARVAANALALVERELLRGPEQDHAERARLRALLGRDGDLDALNRELCRRIRSGDLGPDTPGLLAHLRETTLAKLAVDQPRYAGYRRARTPGRSDGPEPDG